MQEQVIADPAQLTTRYRQPLGSAAYGHHDLAGCELPITNANGVVVNELAPTTDQLDACVRQCLDVNAVETVHLLAHVLQQH